MTAKEIPQKAMEIQEDAQEAIQSQKIPESVLDELKHVMRENTEDPTKFTIVRDMNTYGFLNWFTEFKNTDDAMRMNKIEAFIGLLPIVFGNPDKPQAKINQTINGITNVFRMHVIQHKTNMVSVKRKREIMVRDTLRGDNAVIADNKKAFMGMK